MEQQLLREQPNFSTAAGGLRLAADHLELCEHLPAVDGGARLIQRMDAVLEQLTLLNRKVDTLDRKVVISSVDLPCLGQQELLTFLLPAAIGTLWPAWRIASW